MSGTDDRIHRTIVWIEQNYAAQVRLEDMATVSCMSKYHFSRVFSRVVGLSPFEYLSQYRLLKSLELILETEKTMTEVAASSGFDSSTSFNIAFRKLFSSTPSAVRKSQNSNLLKELRKALKARGSGMTHHPSTNGFLRRIWEVNVTVKQVPSFEIAYVTSKGNILDNKPGWMVIGQWAMTHGCMPPEQVFVGIPIDNPETTPENGCRYMHCVTIPAGFDRREPGTVEFEVVDGGLYAQYSFYDKVDKLAIAYRSLFTQWLAESEYEFEDTRPCLEFTLNDPFSDPEGKARVDLHVPIRIAIA